MTNTVESLWPDEIRVDVRTPVAMLRVQAGLLAQHTKGLLEGAVETVQVNELVRHQLVVIARGCRGYRHTLLALTHDTRSPYPVTVDDGQHEEAVATDDQGLQTLLREALSAPETKSLLASLIAVTNESRPPDARDAPSPIGAGLI